MNGKKCKLQIWDTAGQERFRTITANYYKYSWYKEEEPMELCWSSMWLTKSHLRTLTTGLTKFKSITILVIDRNGSNGSQIILVGNKVDLGNKRVISEDQAEKYAKKHSLNYVEVSACNAMNINLIFETVVKNILILK